MRDIQQQKILSAFQLVLRPVVRILLRHGIGVSQFVETLKTAFVDVATSEFGIRGRPTNISRVAVMTGLTRKEVRRIRTKIETGKNEAKTRTTPLAEVLHGWHASEDFLDDMGKPLSLPFGGAGSTFTSLVKKFGGDVPPGAMRTELKRVGAIEESDDGCLTVTSRTFVSADSAENLVTFLIHNAYPLLSTLEKNTQPDVQPGEGYAQFTAYSTRIAGKERKRLRRVSYERLRETAVLFDDLFSSYESAQVDSSSDKGNEPPVSVGLFFFEETDKNANYEW